MSLTVHKTNTKMKNPARHKQKYRHYSCVFGKFITAADSHILTSLNDCNYLRFCLCTLQAVCYHRLRQRLITSKNELVAFFFKLRY